MILLCVQHRCLSLILLFYIYKNVKIWYISNITREVKMKKMFDKLQKIVDKIHGKMKPVFDGIKKKYEHSKLQKVIHFLKIDKLVHYLIDIHFFSRVLLLVIIPVIIYLYSQYLCNGKFIFERPRMKFNFILIYIVIALLYCLIGKIRIAVLVSMIISFIIGFINHFLTSFRGTPLVPWDIFSLNVALRVLPTFKFTINKNLLFGTVLFLLGIIIYKKLKFKSFKNGKLKILVRLILLCFITSFFFKFYTTDLISKYSLDENWDPKEEYHNNGLFASLFKQSKNLVINQPEGYDINSLTELSKTLIPSKQEVPTDAEETTEVTPEVPPTEEVLAKKQLTDYPNIIVVMNESWTDLSVVGHYTYNYDSLRYYKSLSKNAIKGNLHVSVFGATTPNSEWEFLTSNSMAFVPKRTVPYQQYVLRNSYSLASILKSIGYNTSAIHCYYPQGYNRNLAYPRLGFNSFYHINTLHDLEYIREYPSDLSTFKNIIEIYENKKPDERIFNFTLTMQNHGSYTDEIFANTVVAENNMYPKLNQYLSLLRLSDEALKYLLEYFEKQDEHTIVVMFGDHQPYLEDEFYNSLLGQKYLDTTSMEAVEQKYITPYLIWANYDINVDEFKTSDISANYLASLLLDVADIEKTPYLTFLDGLRKEVPVITGNGYIDKNHHYHNFSETNEYSELINNYHYLQFNNMFDNSSKIVEMFEFPQEYLPEHTPAVDESTKEQIESEIEQDIEQNIDNKIENIVETN